MNRMLRVKDVQERLGLGKDNAYALVRMKGFPKIEINNRYYILEDDFEQWLKSNVGHKIIL